MHNYSTLPILKLLNLRSSEYIWYGAVSVNMSPIPVCREIYISQTWLYTSRTPFHKCKGNLNLFFFKGVSWKMSSKKSVVLFASHLKNICKKTSELFCNLNLFSWKKIVVAGLTSHLLSYYGATKRARRDKAKFCTSSYKTSKDSE